MLLSRSGWVDNDDNDDLPLFRGGSQTVQRVPWADLMVTIMKILVIMTWCHLHSPVGGGKLMKKQKISHKQENSSRFHTIAEKQTYMAVDKLVVSPV